MSEEGRPSEPTDDLRITSGFSCVARGLNLVAASGSQVAAGGDCWLLTAVRGHFGDTPGARQSCVGQLRSRARSETRRQVISSVGHPLGLLRVLRGGKDLPRGSIE